LEGDSSKLVIDLSCRRVGAGWRVAMDRWQTITEFAINKGKLVVSNVSESFC